MVAPHIYNLALNLVPVLNLNLRRAAPPVLVLNLKLRRAASPVLVLALNLNLRRAAPPVLNLNLVLNLVLNLNPRRAAPLTLPPPSGAGLRAGPRRVGRLGRRLHGRRRIGPEWRESW